MKNFFKTLCAFVLVMMVAVVSGLSQAIGVDVPEKQTLLQMLSENWEAILIAVIPLLEFVSRLYPTSKAGGIVRKVLDVIFFFIPDKKKGGGVHKE